MMRLVGAKRRHGLGIRGRAVISLVVLAVFMAVNSLVLVYQSSAIVASYERLNTSQAAMTSALTAATRDTQIAHALYGYVRLNRPVLRVAYSQIGHRVSDTDRKALQGEQSAVAQQISQAATQLEAVESQALMQMDAGKQTEALAMLDNEAYRSWQNYFTNAVRQFLAGQQDLAVSLRQDIRNEWRTLLIWFGGITIMTLLVCIGLLVVMTRQVLQPIARLEQAALALGRGDLEARVQVTSSDELGRLGVVFNKMAVVLNEQAMSSTERLRKITRDLGER